MLAQGKPGSWSSVGEVQRSPDILADISNGESHLERAVETGMFSITALETFTRLDYFERSPDWAEYLERPRTGGFYGNDEKLTLALERLDSGEDCLLVESVFSIASYLKLPATA